MKPLILTLENINSYREKQTVDFSSFMQGGIFGIFGNTGSDKSTILDAIMLALYGEIPRSGARAGRSFINLQADRAEVTLTFACGERTFRAERAFRVRRSGVDSTAALYELTGEARFTRNELARFLESRNIQTRNLFAGNLTRHPCFEPLTPGVDYRIAGPLDATDRIMRDALWIGVYPGMTPEKLEYMAESVRAFCRGEAR